MILVGLALLAANPSSLDAVVAAASGGDTVRLAAAHYGSLTIQGRAFIPALTIDASAATVDGVQVFNSSGVRWVGGTIKGDATQVPTVGYGFYARQSTNITLASVHLSDLRVGIVFDHVSGGQITGNWLARMSTDGIDLALSRAITVSQNACSEFAPSDEAHPDCIQLWSRPSDPPVADVTISGNTVVGAMQGISLFNHVRDGVDDGGFDRITIVNNTVNNIYSNGIAVYDCRDCTVRYNNVSSLPNYINRAQLYVTGGSVDVCGNIVALVPRQAGPACSQ